MYHYSLFMAVLHSSSQNSWKSDNHLLPGCPLGLQPITPQSTFCINCNCAAFISHEREASLLLIKSKPALSLAPQHTSTTHSIFLTGFHSLERGPHTQPSALQTGQSVGNSQMFSRAERKPSLPSSLG